MIIIASGVAERTLRTKGEDNMALTEGATSPGDRQLVGRRILGLQSRFHHSDDRLGLLRGELDLHSREA